MLSTIFLPNMKNSVMRGSREEGGGGGGGGGLFWSAAHKAPWSTDPKFVLWLPKTLSCDMTEPNNAVK